MTSQDTNNKNNNSTKIRSDSNKKKKNKNNEDENDNRAIKPPIFTKYSSSSDEEEEEGEEEKEQKKENDNIPINQEETKTKKPNIYDELLHAYGTNYDYEIKKVKFSKESNKNVENNRENVKILKNNALKNMVYSKTIYTDKETDKIRRDFKRKLTHNEYRNTNEEIEDESDLKNIHKIKTNKAKIKKFKAKNELDNEYYNKMTLSKKDTGNSRPHGNKAKIRKFPNNARNIIDDYEYNNIVLQNSTFNQTTYNYYTNGSKKPTMRIFETHTSKNKNPYSIKTNKSVGNRSKVNKSKNRTILRY